MPNSLAWHSESSAHPSFPSSASALQSHLPGEDTPTESLSTWQTPTEASRPGCLLCGTCLNVSGSESNVPRAFRKYVLLHGPKSHVAPSCEIHPSPHGKDVYLAFPPPPPAPGVHPRAWHKAGAVRTRLREEGGKGLARDVSAKVGADPILFLEGEPRVPRTEEDGQGRWERQGEGSSEVEHQRDSHPRRPKYAS